MIRRRDILTKINQPDFKSEKITYFQNASDITNQLRRAEKQSREASKKLAQHFYTGDPKNTAFRVWRFLRKEIQYKAEPSTNQNAKTINRFLSDGFGDCKHYATTIVGILNQIPGVKAWFTLVGQNKDLKKPNHAYASALINGEIITIDPCRNHFDSEADYFYKWDIQPLK